MLEWLDTEETRFGAKLVGRAIERIFSDPEKRTRDLGGSLSTAAMGDLIAEEL
jgi:isocitrate/isopropylmalate dehydrogenase